MARYERDRDGVIDSWEVEVDGTVIWIREGRFWRRPDGTIAGGDLDWASRPVRGLFRGIDKERARLVEQYVRNGFALVADAAIGVARDAAMEARLVDHPDDAALHSVYADWLQQHGDARGVWASVLDGDAALAARLCAQAERELRLHLGVDRGPRFGWHKGLLVWCSAETAQLDNLLHHPLGSTLVDARVRLTATRAGLGVNVAEVAEVFARHPSLRRLHLADFELDEEATLSFIELGDLSRLWPAVRNLQQLVLQAGGMELGELDLPSLRTLDIRTTALTLAELVAVVRPRPTLERLSLWFGEGQELADEVGPLLDGAAFPSLRALGLCNCAFTDQLVEQLAHSPLLPRLHTLDLSLGTLSDEGLESMVRNQRAFAHLDELDLHESFLSPKAAKAAARLCKRVVTTDQKPHAPPTPRYVTVGE